MIGGLFAVALFKAFMGGNVITLFQAIA